jgi:hypothetical protein
MYYSIKRLSYEHMYVHSYITNVKREDLILYVGINATIFL